VGGIPNPAFYNTFKFRGLARESTAKLPAPTIGLLFRSKIPVG